MADPSVFENLEEMVKKVRYLIIIELILCLSIISSLLASCSAGREHTHSYGVTETLRSSTCTEGGEVIRKCTKCGAGDKYAAPRSAHILTDWTDNGDGEYIKTCTLCGEIIAREKIYTEYSTGLELKHDYRSDHYTVAGIGSCTDRVIVIPREMNGLPVTEIGAEAFAGCKNIDAVIIPDTVTEIGARAFGGTPLKSVFIPDSVERIDGGAFARCRQLTELILPNSLTALGGGVFANASSLYEIIIPPSLTKIEAFANSSLKRISIPSAVTKIPRGAFKDCAELEEILLPDTLTEIGQEAFAGCVSLKHALLPDGIEILGASAFKGCTSLYAVSIPKGVTSLAASVFEDCPSLKKIYLHSELRYIHGTSFLGVNVAEAEFLMPEKNGWLYKVGSSLIGSDPDAVQVGSTLVQRVPDTVIIGSADGSIPTNGNITRIGGCAFRDRRDLKHIVIPKNITYIGGGAFYGCTNVVSISYEGTVAEWEKVFLGVKWFESYTVTSVKCSDGEVKING